MTRAGFSITCGSVGWVTALLLQVLLVCLMEPHSRLAADDVPALLIVAGTWWLFLVLAAWWLGRFVRPAAARPSPLRVASGIALLVAATTTALVVLVKRLAPGMADALGAAVPIGFFVPQLVAAWVGAGLGARRRAGSDVQRAPADQG